MWIDALCINQADPNECSRQVSMMREIYFQAKSVVVWLGSQDVEFDTCLADADMVKMRYEDAEQTRVSDTTQLHKPLLDSGSYHVDTPLFRNEFFRRAWVLQEVYNAREVSVLYGNKMIPWHLILRLNECIARSTIYSNPVAKNAMPPLFAELFLPGENTDKFPAYSASYSAQSVRNGILDVILEGLDLEATDPRDKIFALLSFGKETSDFTCHPPEIRPDYTKTSAQVFADFTKWWIQTHQSLRILSAVHISRNRTWMELDIDEGQAPAEDYPSWSLWHTGKSIWAQGTLALNASSTYYTSGNTTPTFGTLEDSAALSLLGRRISTIAQILTYPYYCTYFRHIENDNNAQPCSQQAIYDAYVHLSDPLAWRGTWTSRLQRSDMQELRQPYDRKLTYDKNFDHFLAHARPSAERPDQIELEDNPSVGCHGPRWFCTPDGVEGLYPPMAKVGDLIVVLYGGRVPYVLRPQKGKGDEITRYSFIGECYLEGYMHGRALDLQDGGKDCPEQFFNLI
jgi:Heterokaryon incompatibility protein (HET)